MNANDWREWAHAAQTDLGARLAETVGQGEPSDDAIREARNHMIQAEALLAGVPHPACLSDCRGRRCGNRQSSQYPVATP